MPLGVLSKEAFDAEVKKFETPTVEIIQRGRGHVAEVPSEVRALIAQEALTNGQTKKIADAFGISKSSVDAYKNDATSTASYDRPDKTLKAKNDEVRDLITTTARQKILTALNALTEEKINDAKPRDLAGIAKDMSSVVRSIEDQTSGLGDNGVKVVIYQPRMKEEDDFPSITVVE